MAVFPSSEKSCLSYCQCITLQALFNRTELASGARSGSYFPFCHPQLSPRVLTPCSRSQHADATVTPTWLLLSATARLRHRPLFTCFCRGAYEARLSIVDGEHHRAELRGEAPPAAGLVAQDHARQRVGHARVHGKEAPCQSVHGSALPTASGTKPSA
jgi:hypothetical protein